MIGTYMLVIIVIYITVVCTDAASWRPSICMSKCIVCMYIYRVGIYVYIYIIYIYVYMHQRSLLEAQHLHVTTCIICICIYIVYVCVYIYIGVCAGRQTVNVQGGEDP